MALVTGYAVIGSFPPLISRWLPPTDIGVMLVVRFLVQVAIFGVIMLVAKLPRGLPSNYSILAGVAFATYSFLFFESIKLTDISHAIILSSFYPIEIIVVVSLLGKLRITWREIAGTAAVTLGTVVLWTHMRLTNGDLLAFASSFAFAGYLLCNTRVVFGKDAKVAIVHQAYVSATSATCILILIPVLLVHPSGLAYDLRGSWIAGALIAIAGALSHSLLTLAQRQLTPLIASIAAVSSPVIATLLGALLFDHTRIINAAVGTALCAGGLIVVNYRSALGVERFESTRKGID